ncbi:MAG: barstar family protein [Bacilli bacterium]|nr:barstar family protein [Bacilli bacterium]
MHITIDGKKIKNINDLHMFLKKTLNFSNYYGNNFDALNDVLFEYPSLSITIINSDYLLNNLKNNFFVLLDILKDNNINVLLKVGD